MSEMMIQPDSLRGGAEQFDLAGKDLDEILKRLDGVTGGLKEEWAGVSQQVFYKQYAELRQYMEAFTLLMGQISLEMNAMAERFEKADR